MRLWRRSEPAGAGPPGGTMSLREAARNYGLEPSDPPVPWSELVPAPETYRVRVQRWWYEVRDYWARKIAP